MRIIQVRQLGPFYNKRFLQRVIKDSFVSILFVGTGGTYPQGRANESFMTFHDGFRLFSLDIV